MDLRTVSYSVCTHYEYVFVSEHALYLVMLEPEIECHLFPDTVYIEIVLKAQVPHCDNDNRIFAV